MQTLKTNPSMHQNASLPKTITAKICMRVCVCGVCVRKTLRYMCAAIREKGALFTIVPRVELKNSKNCNMQTGDRHDRSTDCRQTVDAV